MLVQLSLFLFLSFSLFLFVEDGFCLSMRLNGARLFPCIIDTDSFASLSRGFDPPRQSGKNAAWNSWSSIEGGEKAEAVRSSTTREQRCGPARRFSPTRHCFPDNSLRRAIAKLLVGSRVCEPRETARLRISSRTSHLRRAISEDSPGSSWGNVSNRGSRVGVACKQQPARNFVARSSRFFSLSSRQPVNRSGE